MAMRYILLAVLFGFLVFVYPAQELNQYDYHSADKPTISEFAYLPDAKMISYPSSVSLQKHKTFGIFIPFPSEYERKPQLTYLQKHLLLSEVFPDARGFLNVNAVHSNYL
ncbi:hypothetical protein [Bacillus sp. RAR_GA_16]|uniref:hypothetical protein n=1 Tax=Bacillus sp. RAR_GA_16 TaxID=2876774 RepID=UPI001CCA8F5D|nr:hypothetical protein [Bacillus sp. RAR_GA_16]MCA0172207.1 hypothetical protein [Bacillus sp. RAR_GA_16]